MYKCPVCRSVIDSWVVKDETFECPDCKASLASNSRRSLRQSFVVAFVVWLVFLIGMRIYSGSWGYAAAVSIEGGGMLSAILAGLYYHLVVRIREQVKQ